MTLREHEHDNVPKHPRPAFKQPRLILYVFLGGVIGAGARLGIELALPWSNSGIPWAIVIANVGGAMVLGALLTALARLGNETPGRRDLRLFAGTGMLGGFTTYSSFATDTAVLFGTEPVMAIAYGLVSVVAGVVAAALGVWLATKIIPDASAKGARGA